MPIKTIAASELQIGMYVSSLDRPWTETPFMFQGFEVKNQQDIEDLCQHARQVHVIIPDEEIELGGTRGYSPEAHEELSANLHQTDYGDPVPIEKELQLARASSEVFNRLFKEIESLAGSGKTLPYQLFEQPARNLVESVTRNPDAYIWLTRLRKFDSFLYRDSLSSAVWAAALGRKIGLTESALQNLAVGAMLMDIGKMRLPAELLHKQDRLTDNEWSLMKTHVDLGLNLLESSGDYPQDVLNIIRTHHERLNGCGYPNGLEGSQIPLFGQIAGIVDQYVAVTSPRPFSSVISPSQAEQMLYKQRGVLFDEMLVEYFIQTLSTYPTGSLVELSSGEIGVVKAQKPGHHLRPDVILLLDAEKQPYGSFTLINLDNYHIDNQPVRITKTLADGEYGINIEELSL